MSGKKCRVVIGMLAILILMGACAEKTDDPVKAEMAVRQAGKPADPPEGVQFVEYDVPPTPIGGFGVIQQNLTYPETAREQGTEGRVVLYAKVNTAGEVVETKVAESLSAECDAAAIQAISAVKWEPARKADTSVDVWVAIPIDFRLK